MSCDLSPVTRAGCQSLRDIALTPPTLTCNITVLADPWATATGSISNQHVRVAWVI